MIAPDPLLLPVGNVYLRRRLFVRLPPLDFGENLLGESWEGGLSIVWRVGFEGRGVRGVGGFVFGRREELEEGLGVLYPSQGRICTVVSGSRRVTVKHDVGAGKTAAAAVAVRRYVSHAWS